MIFSVLVPFEMMNFSHTTSLVGWFFNAHI
jgi:hypothetical protein